MVLIIPNLYNLIQVSKKRDVGGNDMEFKISELKDYTPQIGHLVSMMDYARKTTLDAVQGMSTE